MIIHLTPLNLVSRIRVLDIILPIQIYPTEYTETIGKIIHGIY